MGQLSPQSIFIRAICCLSGNAIFIGIVAAITGHAHMEGYMRVRDRRFPGTPPASTLMIVSGFTRPEFVVEIEAIAAAPE